MNNRAGAAARFRAVEVAAGRKPRRIEFRDGAHPGRPSELFRTATFDTEAMRQRLSRETFAELRQVVGSGGQLRPDIAGEVAHALKEWAIERGATHFCHWFQPQTGLTAEKHDAFLALDADGVPIERFSAQQILQSEPDASSFPSGGMRSTFEARGYTAWDPSSPIFLMDGVNGRTLCIPSVFISYHGDALDTKTPLLRSMAALDHAAGSLLRLLGHPAKRVVPTVGAEQEFFLVDRAFHALRPDLLACGRTLLGAPPAKGQQLDDHYFGSIRPRVLACLQEVEHELYRLGVPAATRHNEVAPAQYEIAPVHEEANVAADHNQLLMETLRTVAHRHDLAVLLHPKPFAGVNGSGKHCNWSLLDDRGNNLLEPPREPTGVLRFLVCLLAVLKGVQRRAGVLRAAVAEAGNDHRLGANEAPPAIISVFLGADLSALLEGLAEGQEGLDLQAKGSLTLNLPKLPDLERDNTDRNRTSPFAFTGAKFEFRAVASNASVATPVAYLNAVVAEAFTDMEQAVRARMQEGLGAEAAAVAVVRQVARQTRTIRFDGNNYASGWVQEAEQRGLPNLPTAPDGLEQLVAPETEGLFTATGVYSAAELESCYRVRMGRYLADLLIEADCLTELVRTVVLPAALFHQGERASALQTLRETLALPSAALADEVIGPQENALFVLARLVGDAHRRVRALEVLIDSVRDEPDEAVGARRAAAELVPALKGLREVCDALEGLVPDGAWPLPKYREMLSIL